ncbi:MAG: YIP1 family protein [Deltaproteobacteria bacterium]
MVWSEVLYGVLFEPRTTLRSLSIERPLAPAIITFMVVALFNLTVYRGIIFQQNYTIEDIGQFLWLYQVMGALFSFLMLFVMAGLFSLLSELLFNKTNASGLLVCLGFASLPGILGPALYFSAFIIDAQWLGVLCSVLVGIWMLVLQVLSLSEALEISTGQAVALFILPGVFAAVTLILAIMIFALFGQV